LFSSRKSFLLGAAEPASGTSNFSTLNKRPDKTQLQSRNRDIYLKSQDTCVYADSVGTRTTVAAFMNGKRSDTALPGITGSCYFGKGMVKTVESLQIVKMQDAAGF
jgi:hypothetical protein